MKKNRRISTDPLAVFRSGKKSGGFVSFASQHIAHLEEKGKDASRVRYSVNSFLRFTNGQEVSFEELNSNLIESYDKWLSDNGTSRNTAATYLRNLHTIYNYAKKEGVHISEQDPFLTVNTQVVQSEKKVEPLTIKELLKIRNADFSSNSSMDLARDMFMFSLYTHGMTTVDIAGLKKDNVKNGTLTYFSGLSGKQVSIDISKPVKDILVKYIDSKSTYLFPFVSDGDDINQQRHKATNFRARVKRGLDKISKNLGFNKELSILSARVTWDYLSSSTDILGSYLAAITKSDNKEAKQSNKKEIKKVPKTEIEDLYAESAEGIKASIETSEEYRIAQNLWKEEKKAKEPKPWTELWQAYINRISEGKPLPSRNNPNDKEILNWYIRSRYSYKHKKLSEEYKKMFKQLLKEKDKYEKTIIAHQKRLTKDRSNRKAAAKRLSNSPLSNVAEKYSATSIRDASWLAHYDKYKSFLLENKRLPAHDYSNEEGRLCSWLNFNRRKLKLWQLHKEQESLLKDLLKLLEEYKNEQREVRKKETIERNKRKKEAILEKNKVKKVDKSTTIQKRKAKPKTNSSQKLKASEKTSDTTPKVNKQDLQWYTKYNAYMDYLTKFKHRPLKSKTEDQVLYNWFKTNMKLLKLGMMKLDRVLKFQKLLEQIVNLQAGKQ